jgi:hypothetical protein
MRASVEGDGDLPIIDVDVDRHIDEVPENVARLRVGATAHSACEQATESTGECTKNLLVIATEPNMSVFSSAGPLVFRSFPPVSACA